MRFFALFLALLAISYVRLESTFDLTPDYHVPKTIMFSCSIGGSSHVQWVLSILEELTSRGHRAIFYATDNHAKFIKSYPSVELISSGPSPMSQEEFDQIYHIIAKSEPVDQMIYYLSVLHTNYTKAYLGHRQMFDYESVDIVLCDQFHKPCLDAAVSAKIPLIATSTFLSGPDSNPPYINTDITSSHNPTSKNVPFFRRIKENIIDKIRLINRIGRFVQKRAKEQEELGIQTSLDMNQVSKNSVKLSNNLFGLIPTRPLGPLSELIGPIMPKSYPGLTDELKDFLDRHSKVVYVAFGQHVIPTTKEINLILTLLFDNLESGNLDGIIWVTRGKDDLLPETIVTHSKKKYDIYQSDSIVISPWAPQVAILHHPSSALFITHGGFGSVSESLYQGVPVVVYPFFGDQHGTAVMAEESGFGRWLRKEDLLKDGNKMKDVVSEVLQDRQGQYKRTLQRFKALVQIRSLRGVQRGADVVEEVLFTHQDGELMHRHDVRHDLSFLKAYNLDIYLFSAAVVLGSLLGLVYLIIFVLRKFLSFKKSKSA
ncbi:hypothetical protein G6F56_008814 [Rhizopus delemar]|nr:hypothetical protein G6F56_008814 [Rhizopus delemar]